MDSIYEYYVVGIYNLVEEKPSKIYKITTNLEQAIRHYFMHYDNPKCYVGIYVNNKLTELGKFTSTKADGPGIVNTSEKSVSIEELDKAEDDYR